MKPYEVYATKILTPNGRLMKVVELGGRKFRTEERYRYVIWSVKDTQRAVKLVRSDRGAVIVVGLDKGEKDDGRYITLLSGKGTHSSYTKGDVYAPSKDDAEKIRVVDYGFGFTGSKKEDRGVFYEYLAVIEPPAWVYVKPSGDTPPYYLYFTPDYVMRVDEDRLLAFCDIHGVNPPSTDKGEYIPLSKLPRVEVKERLRKRDKEQNRKKSRVR